MNYWLMKSEPDVYSIDDLEKKHPQSALWDGVRNYQVRNMMRDQMQPGDQAFFYHSNCKPPGIVGIMEITSKGYPDVTAIDPKHRYFDPKSDPQNPRWYGVDVRFIRKLKRMLSLEELKQSPALIDLPIIKRGNRLSIIPLSQEDWQHILNLE